MIFSQAAKLIVLYDLKEGLYREENESCEEGEEQLQNESQSADEGFYGVKFLAYVFSTSF